MSLIKNTQRTLQIKLLSSIIKTITFEDTNPNILQIKNYGADTIYISQDANLSPNNFTGKINAGNTGVFTSAKDYQTINLMSESDINLTLNSWEDNSPEATSLERTIQTDLSQSSTQQHVIIDNSTPEGHNHIGTVTIDNADITVKVEPSVEITNDVGNPIPMQQTNPIPTGTNSIGKIEVTSLPSLPTGTNSIGNVEVTSLPSLPSGTNSIGNVEVTSLPSLPSGTNSIGNIEVTNFPNNNISTPTILNITCPTKGTEYNAIIPATTKSFSLSCNDYDETNIISIYYTTGATNVIKIKGNAVYSIDNLKLSNALTIYFKNSIDSKNIQLECWS